MAKSCEIPNNELTEFDLPRVCVMTGSYEAIEFRPVKFQWYPRWVAIFAFALVIAAILIAVLTKRVNGHLPFSPAGWEKYQRGKRFTIFALLSFMVGLFMIIGGGASNSSALLLLGCAVAFVLPVVLLVGFTRGTRITVTKITDSHITLKLPSDVAADAFSSHLVGAGSTAPALR